MNPSELLSRGPWLRPVFAAAMLSSASAGVGPDPYAEVRGMTISCHGIGLEWGTDEMVRTMAELRDLGVNWIAIHPYAGIGRDGTVGGGRLDRLYADPTWLTRPIAEAHRLGLKIMIKPHIAYCVEHLQAKGPI